MRAPDRGRAPRFAIACRTCWSAGATLTLIALLVASVVLASCNSAVSPVADLAPTLSLRDVSGATVAYENGVPVPDFNDQPRHRIQLDGSWRWQGLTMNDGLSLGNRSRTLSLIVRHAAGREQPGFDDRGWASAAVPGTFSAPPVQQANGGWYRRTFEVPDSWSGLSATLKFGAVNYVADVWLNGHYLGYHEGGATPFAFGVTRWLRRGRANTIAVRVDDPVWGTRNDIVPWGLADWWNYGGILGSVWLEASSPLHTVRADVVSHLDGADVGFLVANDGGHSETPSIRIEILPAAVTAQNVLDPNPLDLVPAAVSPVAERTMQLGSLGPHSVFHGDATFGLRQIRVDSTGPRLLLNGTPVVFHGVAVQDQQQVPPSNGNPSGGPVTNPQQVLQLLDQALAVNADLVRADHHPPDQWLPMLADRLGIAVWEEIPLYHYTPQTFSIVMSRGIPQQMLVEMDLRDMNRPSVLFHGFANESTGDSERSSALTTLRDLDRRVDGTRLTGQAAYGSDPTDPTQSPLDVAGFTWYWGVFYGGSLSERLIAHELDRAHQAQPQKPILILEFGHWADNAAEESYQAWYLRTTYAAMRSRFSTAPHGYVAAAVWWSLDDYWTQRPGIGVEHFGLFRPDGSERPAGGALAQLYGAGAQPRTQPVLTGGLGQPAPEGTPPTTVAVSAVYAVGLPLGALLLVIGLLGAVARVRRRRGGPGGQGGRRGPGGRGRTAV
jgi:beta-glucuronidase